MENLPEISEWSITNFDILLLAGALVITLVVGYGLYRLFLGPWIHRRKYPTNLRWATAVFMVFFALSLMNIPGWPVFDSLREIYQWLTWVFIGLTVGVFVLFVVLVFMGLRTKNA